VHDPRGKFLGACTRARAAQLLAALAPVDNTFSDNDPQLKPRTYADEMGAALVRGKHYQSQLGAPVQAWNVIHTALGYHGVTERYTTSLTRDPRFTSYCSPHAGNQAFGSMGGPLQTLWAGISLVVPPVDNHISLAAVRHAVCSSMALQAQGIASITVLLLRASNGNDIPGYHAWLNRCPQALPLATFTANQPAWRQDHWHTAPTPMSTTTQQYHMFVVYNQAANTQYPGWKAASHR
jgi:hypothetical protein